LLIGIATLQMRQQQLELKHQAAALQQRIEQQQSKLWNQQLRIALMTAPPAISQTVGDELDLVPNSALKPEAAEWLRSHSSRQ
jgi:hypothetical protein